MVGVSDDIIAQRLAAFGEAFMASFDEPSTSAPRQRPQPAPAPPAAGQGRQQAGRKDAPPRQQQPAPSAAAPLAASPSKPPRNEIDEVMRKHKSRLQSQQQRAGSASPQQRQRDTSSAPLTAGRTPANTPSQSERKKFMSPKAADIFSGPSTSSQPTPGSGGRSADVDMAEADTQLSPEAFKQLQLEVERLGASGLDAKAQKQWKAQLMVRLGAKPEKGQRTAACIGKGVAKKAGQRQARALQEAIQAGMARAKGGKKKRQQAAAPAGGRPKSAGGEGLQELGGTFRNGVLKMKSPQRK